MNTLELLSYNTLTLRTRQGLTQGVIAERAGITRKHLLNIEKGRILPSATILDALAKALEVSVSELFAEPDTKDREREKLMARIDSIIDSRIHILISEIKEELKKEE